MNLPSCTRFSLRSEYTKKRGEMSSPHGVIEVVILRRDAVRQIIKPRQEARQCARAGLVFACSLQEIEFLSAADGRPAVVHPELAVDVLGVGTHGVQGYHQFAGNFRTVQFGSEQP
jgi:hypothetical protein